MRWRQAEGVGMNLQTDFASALLDPASPPPAGLTSWNGSDPAQRFGVYRNNVAVSLIDALAARFPVVQALVGEEFFRDMARVFVRSRPPRSRLLMDYGDDFPIFVEGFESAGSVPYLGDVARLESARTRAFHAADAPALGPDAFERVAATALHGLRVALHPSVRLLRSRFAIVSLWAAHQGAFDIGAVDPFEPEDAIVLRPHLAVLTMRLPPGVACFLAVLQSGQPLAEVALAAAEETPAFDLSAALHLLMTSGAATSLSSPDGAAQ
jgi:hypothetical protein